MFCYLFSIQSYVNAQELTKAQLDSVTIIIKNAFDLSQQSKHSEAIKVGSEVLEYAKNHKSDFLKAKALNVLGVSYYALGESDKSLEYFFNAKKLYEKIKDTSRIIVIHNNIGALYRYKGNYIESNLYFKKAMEIAEKYKKYDAAVYPTFNIGYNLVFEKEDYNQGIIFIEKSLQLASVANNIKSERIKADAYEVLGYAYYKIKNKAKSKMYYDKAIEQSEDNGYLEALQAIYKSRAELYEEEKQYEKANALLYKLIKINDSITKVAKIEQIKEMEIEFSVKENKNKLKLIESEKAIQEMIITKSKMYNFILIAFILMLLINAYWIFKKNKQLQLARNKAENLSKAKSDFYSEISHELRTPLYAVIELSNLLLKENINVQHKEYLESLKFSGNHLLSLINNVLQLNKVESGKMKIEMIDFNLKNLTINIIESLEYALRDSNNTIHLNYDNTIPSIIVGDSLKLSQVLINLISNAIKFTNNGNITIEIKQLENYKEQVKIYFKVTDDGLGIPKNKQSHVFEDFHQEYAKNKNSYKGTGLGLSIVKRIVDAMGGKIEIESEEGKGASFFFSLIFNKTEKMKLPITQYENHLKAINNCKLLIVDDNKINQMVTTKVLEHLNIESIAVDSGKKAIEILKTETFDCVLMDLHMPELDGYETTNLIREFNEDIAIVALTAASTNEVESKIKNSKMDGYILKPFITEDFVKAISNAIVSKK
ncbi:ATP-binding protein [uncultured Lacinutrix sp.]|uniref:tetratricopeptide repeat-containing hybrid sensor histidine kinase/response regulator n=1 Tax=uncultured Lacinutrix sp. TaxID=574032 RepID=UPI0026208FD4|nr:ATP-binding protein [uncultured Lacinutrix sp.]